MLPHPYYSMTSESGKFSITNIPTGKYRLIAWHPFGTNEKDVQIEESQMLTVNIDFKPTSPVIYPEDDKRRIRLALTWWKAAKLFRPWSYKNGMNRRRNYSWNTILIETKARGQQKAMVQA